MKNILKRHYFLTIVLASFLIIVSLGGVVEAQQVISGDDVCGERNNKCSLFQLANVTQNLLQAIIILGLPLLIVFITYRLVVAWYALQQGNSNAYKEALGKITNAIIGFIIIVAFLGGVFLAMLKFFGVQEFPLKLLETIFSALIPVVHAQQSLPNPVAANDLYDFILSVLRLVMRFFIYPAFIVMWVWTGIKFVMAEGNPQELDKAKKWLLWAFVTTLVVMMLQGLLYAIKASVDRVLTNAPSTVIEIRQM